MLDMTEKVKTVIEFYFLLPDFKSRGHPNCETVTVPGQNKNQYELVSSHTFLFISTYYQYHVPSML